MIKADVENTLWITSGPYKAVGDLHQDGGLSYATGTGKEDGSSERCIIQVRIARFECEPLEFGNRIKAA